MRYAALALAALSTLAISAPTTASTPTSPVGSWQISSGESRYNITVCGSGPELCAKLVWPRGDAQTADNLPYLNKFVVRGAQPVAPHKWSGSVKFAGETLKGSLTQVNANLMTLQGCKGMFCKSVKLTRI